MNKLIHRVSFVIMVAMLLLTLFGGCSNANGGQSSAQPSGQPDEQSAEASASPEKPSEDKIKVGILVKTFSNIYFREIAYGAVNACEDNNVEFVYGACQTGNDLAGQIQLAEDMLQNGIDALVITPMDSKGIATAIETYNNAGVPVVVVDTMAEDCDIACSIVADEIKIGNEMAATVAEQLGGKGRVILLEGVAGTSSSELRGQGVKEGLAKYPGVELVATQNANYAQEKGQEVMADLLQAHSDIDAVIALNDLMLLGAIVSLEEAGYKVGGPDGVVTYCATMHVSTMDMIKEGKIFGSHYLWPQLQGYDGVVRALKAIKGEPLPEIARFPGKAYIKDNIEEAYDYVEAAANYDFK